jgi:hypothetical protein
MSTALRFRSVCILALALFFVANCCAGDFGARVPYRKDTPIQFTGFTLTYVGERRVVPEKYPRGMIVYDFRVVGAQGAQTVSWSAGTGDIGPAVFHVGNEQFALELKSSDKLGVLKEGELVVSRVP